MGKSDCLLDLDGDIGKNDFMLAGILMSSLSLNSADGLWMPNVFSDGMVLQRNGRVAVWGKDVPGRMVTVKASWGVSGEGRVGADGTWKVDLATRREGGPYEVEVVGSETKKIGDVMLGEVWLCSGQSNMEWPLKVWPGGTQVEGWEEAMSGANFPNMRLLQVPKRHSNEPMDDQAGKWVRCSPDTVASFSAVGFFFGRALHRELNVPIGLINSSFGGTAVELWTSKEGMDAWQTSIGRKPQEEVAQESPLILAMDKEGPEAVEYSRIEFDDGSWVSGGATIWEDQWADFDGVGFLRAEFELPQANMGGVFINLGRVDDHETTYVNGEKIGATIGYNQDRRYRIPRGILKKGKNVVLVRVIDTGGVGGFANGADVYVEYSKSKVPLTAWKGKKGKVAADLIRKSWPTPVSASTLYNGMIEPILPYGIKGAIWYQGESNVGKAWEYRHSFRGMIEDWRGRWGSDFPFYFVQIAPFRGYSDRMGAYLRESQTVVANRLSNTGMVVISDLVPNLGDIHPSIKAPVGERLAAQALAKTYKKPGVVADGPRYKGMQVEGNKVRVTFENTGGELVAKGGALKEFEVLDEAMKFHPAKAEIDGETVLVWAEGVDKPVGVRFAFTDAPVPNLFGKSGLPAWPFRTDRMLVPGEPPKW